MKMKKFDQIILRFLVIGFPFILALMIWAYKIVGNNQTLYTEHYNGAFWNVAGIFFIIWVALAVLTLMRLLLNSNFREEVLSKVVRVKERDESEISTQATKFSFFANLALLVCLLFFSTLNFKFKKYNNDVFDESGEKRHGQLTMGFGLHTYDEKALTLNTDLVQNEIVYSELPFSKTGIIILLIVWQIGMYHFSTRKELRED
jgi:magnesium-transporting ATPase (P-type)